MSMEGSETVRLEGERFTGFEHHVWLNEITRITSKIPSELGQLWQDMSPEAVERDLEIFDKFDIPIVDTRLYGPRPVEFSEQIAETRQMARYLLLQPLVRPAHAMSFTDLLHFQKHREKLLELVQIREEIKEKYGLGVDLLGGQGFKLVGPALKPWVKKMHGDVGNLLVADDDIETNDSWSEHAVRSNGFVAKKGDALLCDTRLMPIGNADNSYDKILAPLMRKNGEFQDAALWATLEGVDIDPNIIKADQRFDTGFKRMIRGVAKLAIPKMRAQAEEIKKMN